jgi:hypothetical protein
MRARVGLRSDLTRSPCPPVRLPAWWLHFVGRSFVRLAIVPPAPHYVSGFQLSPPSTLQPYEPPSPPFFLHFVEGWFPRDDDTCGQHTLGDQELFSSSRSQLTRRTGSCPTLARFQDRWNERRAVTSWRARRFVIRKHMQTGIICGSGIFVTPFPLDYCAGATQLTASASALRPPTSLKFMVLQGLEKTKAVDRPSAQKVHNPAPPLPVPLPIPPQSTLSMRFSSSHKEYVVH